MYQHATVWGHIINFFDSNFFVGAVTLAVGIAAYSVYSKQKRDSKRDAANIILLEVEAAQAQLDKVSADKPFIPPDQQSVYLMKTASWDKYKYLFVRDFDRDEWDKITLFYINCQAYDQAVRFNKISTEKNQQAVRENLQRILTDHAAKYVEDTISKPGKPSSATPQSEQQYLAERQEYIEQLVGEKGQIFTYVPKQSESDAKRALNNLETSLSITSVGIKLKNIVNKKFLKFWN
jgi:hypothetical protein